MKSLWKQAMALAGNNTLVAGALIGVAVVVVAATSPLWAPALRVRGWLHNRRNTAPNNTPSGAGVNLRRLAAV